MEICFCDDLSSCERACSHPDFSELFRVSVCLRNPEVEWNCTRNFDSVVVRSDVGSDKKYCERTVDDFPGEATCCASKCEDALDSNNDKCDRNVCGVGSEESSGTYQNERILRGMDKKCCGEDGIANNPSDNNGRDNVYTTRLRIKNDYVGNGEGL